MPRFAANLKFLFQELPLMERFKAAADARFAGVEYQFPYGEPVAEMRKRMDGNGLRMVLINAPPGDWQAGDRGLAGLPGRESDFRASMTEAVDHANALGCSRIHVMAGVPGAEASHETALAVLAENLRYAADLGAVEGIRILTEPLNSIDVPGYLIANTRDARAVMSTVANDNLFLQYDLYHGAMNGEDLLQTVRGNLDVIGYMQVASAPGRGEPVGDDIDYAGLFEAIDVMGYTGWIGCEYTPAAGTLAGLGWASVYGIGRPFRAVP